MIINKENINSYEYTNVMVGPLTFTLIPFLIGALPIIFESPTFLWFAFWSFLLFFLSALFGFIAGCIGLSSTGGYGNDMLVDRIPRSESITYIVCCTIFPLLWIALFIGCVKGLLRPLSHIFKSLMKEEK